MTPSPGICAIILAAGYSRRMQRFKPLLALAGKTVIERVVWLYRRAGVTDIRVVTGFRSEAIRSALAGDQVSIIHNPAYDAGMFSSVRSGIETLAADIRSFFIHPVDIPLVRPHTLKMLIEALNRHPSPVIYPVFDNRRGHPPLVSGELKDAIFSHDGNGGLRQLLGHYDSMAVGVQVADEGVLLDLDTPDDFKRLSDRLAMSDCLTIGECRMLVEKVRRLPRPLIDHCLQVARVAEALAHAVNRGGKTLDVALVRSAGRVHDVARFEKNHAAAGACLLREMGFSAMAAVVAAHMEIDVSNDTPLDEAQIVHLADKLVTGNTVVKLSQRFDEKLKAFGHDPAVSATIRKRHRHALTIQDKIERAAGTTVCQILKKAGIVNGGPTCETA